MKQRLVLFVWTALFVAAVAGRRTHAPFRSNPDRNRNEGASSDASYWSDLSEVAVSAPYPNIFNELSDRDRNKVRKFMIDQPTLNLTGDDHGRISRIELLAPNKTAALAYLDDGAEPPRRFARVSIGYHDYIQEFMVGPLPVTEGVTGFTPARYIYGGEAIMHFDQTYTTPWPVQEVKNASYAIADLLHDVFKISPKAVLPSLELPLNANGRTTVWATFWRRSNDTSDDSTLLTGGLYYGMHHIEGQKGWDVIGWYYDGILYKTNEDLLDAWKAGDIRAEISESGQWSTNGWNGEELPLDQIDPPIPIRSAGARYRIDNEENYVEWMDFSFYWSWSEDTGLILRDCRFKGERIIYELGMQEALAHYAASDPMEATSAYLDSEYGFGSSANELLPGYDCPTYATFLNATLPRAYKMKNALCLFEFQKDYPLQRHWGGLLSVTKNVMLVLRAVHTVGNYDYMMTYEFYLDGSIQVLLRASGYIQATYHANNSDYGFHIHQGVSGGMHDHVVNFKLDMDINGTANSLMKTEFVPHSEVYPWSDGLVRNTMKLERQFITNEDQGKINWAGNAAATYAVVNKDAPNEFGEYRGYKVTPSTGASIALTVHNSSVMGNAVNWATHPLYALQHKDGEPKSCYAGNGYNVLHPMVDFNDFFNGESLDQEDLVLYFNLGMHHLPHTGDLPNTLFQTAQSGITIAPQNFLLGDPSRATRQQVGIRKQKVDYYGSTWPSGEFDLDSTRPDLKAWGG